MADLRALLKELAKVEGVHSAVIVGRDGFVIDHVSNEEIDSEAVGAVISMGIGSSEMMGRELEVGEMLQGMLEYQGGIILLGTLGNEAILSLLAEKNANVGHLRWHMKRRAGAILEAMM